MCAFLAHPAPFTNLAQRQSTRKCRRRPPAVCTLSRPPAQSFTSPDNPGGATVPLEDRDVPSSHKGLHETLYGDNAETVHGAGTSRNEEKERFEDNCRTVYNVDSFVDRIGTEKVAGVYKVLNTEHKLMYVGISRNIVLSIQAHRREYGRAKVSFVQVKSFRFPKRAEMEGTRDAWIAENGDVPIGNQEPHWGQVKASVRNEVMTPQERATFEENKFKLRKAMADPNLHTEVSKGDDELSPEDMRSAVEDDDWSSEINRQSQEAVSVQPAESIVSPFAGSEAKMSVSPAVGTELLELNQANVDKVLDSVRPFLLSDGGNVSVVSVNPNSGDVMLQLEGACGTCPSSTMTMQQGIVRALKDAFGDNVGNVSAISDPAAAQRAVLSVELCDAILETEVRSAIGGLGGSVDVISAADGQVVLKYSGPDKLAYGIELILREKAPSVQTVVFQT